MLFHSAVAVHKRVKKGDKGLVDCTRKRLIVESENITCALFKNYFFQRVGHCHL